MSDNSVYADFRISDQYVERDANKIKQMLDQILKNAMVTVQIETKNAEQQISAISDSTKSIPKNVKTTVKADTKSAVSNVNKITDVVEEIPESIDVEVEADTRDAEESIEDVADAIDDVPEDLEVQVDADTGSAESNLQNVNSDIEDIPQDIQIEVDADTTQAESSMSNLDQQITNIGDSASNLTNALKGVAATVVTIATGAKGLGLLDNVAEQADEIDRYAQMFGMSRESIQKWNYIFEDIGTSLTVMRPGMRNFAAHLRNINDEGGKSADIFKKLGVRITEGMSREEAFERTIIALQNVNGEAEKLGLAIQLFGGRQAQFLMPLLNQGNDALLEMTQRYRDLGLQMSSDSINSALEFGNAMGDLRLAISAIFRDVAVDVMPVVKEFAQVLTENLPVVSATISTNLKMLFGFFGFFLKIFSWFITNFPKTSQVVATLSVAVFGLASAAIVARTAFTGLSSALAIFGLGTGKTGKSAKGLRGILSVLSLSGTGLGKILTWLGRTVFMRIIPAAIGLLLSKFGLVVAAILVLVGLPMLFPDAFLKAFNMVYDIISLATKKIASMASNMGVKLLQGFLRPIQAAGGVLDKVLGFIGFDTDIKNSVGNAINMLDNMRYDFDMTWGEVGKEISSTFSKGVSEIGTSIKDQFEKHKETVTGWFGRNKDEDKDTKVAEEKQGEYDDILAMMELIAEGQDFDFDFDNPEELLEEIAKNTAPTKDDMAGIGISKAPEKPIQQINNIYNPYDSDRVNRGLERNRRHSNISIGRRSLPNCT